MKIFGQDMSEPRYWLIVFEDPDVESETFTDEVPARTRFEQCKINWNCSLFMEVDRG